MKLNISVLRITLRQCAYFAAVTDMGVMAQAARQLNVSEPALADAIRKLEDLAGIQLLERFHARGARLTPRGRHFLTAVRPPTDLSYDGAKLAAIPLDRSVPALDILAAWRRDAPVTPLREHTLDTLEAYVLANAPAFGLVVD